MDAGVPVTGCPRAVEQQEINGPSTMADYAAQQDPARPEDEWRQPSGPVDEWRQQVFATQAAQGTLKTEGNAGGNTMQAATQKLADRLAQEKATLGKRDELMLFTYHGDLERVRFVLDAPRAPDIHMRDYGGYNLAAIAAEAGHAEVMRAVMGAGALVDNVDYRGHAPIHHAALHDRVECAHELVKRKAALDVRDRAMGQTALHLACRHGHDRIAKLLLDGGARTDLHDFRDRSAREVAEWFGHAPCVRLLDLYRPDKARPKIDARYLANLCPERATVPLENVTLLQWLASEPGLNARDPRLLAAMETLARSKYRSRYALARASEQDIRGLGLRGSDATRVRARAAEELPDAVDEAVLAAQQRVEDERARLALMQQAGELLDTAPEADKMSVGEASVVSQASKASSIRSTRSNRRSRR